MPNHRIQTYDDESYAESRDPSQRYIYGGNHPDSPSVYSQLTTATRREGEIGEVEDPDAPVIIRVIAPATLQEGYTIDVLYEDEPYTIAIPTGGVKEGEEFETVIDPTYKSANNGSRRMQMDQLVEEDDDKTSRTEDHTRESDSRRSGTSSIYHRQQQRDTLSKLSPASIYEDRSEYTATEEQTRLQSDVIKETHTYPANGLSGDEDEEARNNLEKSVEGKSEDAVWYDENGIPVGGWRTRLCSCFDVLTQSTFWMGLFCTPILIAQLITRLKLTWNGREGSKEETSLSYNRLLLALVFTMTVFWVPAMGSVCLLVYYFVVVVSIGSHVRSYMRKRYKIPSTMPTRCGDRIDDVCMMLFCGCCSSVQMARHTHDDKDYPGHGCTTTGLEFDAPEIV